MGAETKPLTQYELRIIVIREPRILKVRTLSQPSELGKEIGRNRLGVDPKPSEDVVHRTTPKSVALMDEAVLADVIGAFGGMLAEALAHVPGHEREAGEHALLPTA